MKALKLFTAEQIRRWDAHTLQQFGLASSELMERAAQACTDRILQIMPSVKTFHVFCGPGNNGGDGMAVSRLLLREGKPVITYELAELADCSADYKIMRAQLQETPGCRLSLIGWQASFPELGSDDCVLDAIFGTGLNRPADGIAARCIHEINSGQAPVISIDIPSGMSAGLRPESTQAMIRAEYTLSFQVPKISFFFEESQAYCGQWQILDIGLSATFYEDEPCKHYLLDRVLIASLLKKRERFAHKGKFGHALLVAGSYGKMGAAVLAGSAALRSGAGLLSIHAPRCGDQILQTALPEAMLSPDEHDHWISSVQDTDRFSAIGIGCGTGCFQETAYALDELLSKNTAPLVLDADALNLLASDRELISRLPAGSVLTPHVGEFGRLCGISQDSFERHEMQKAFSVRHQVYMVLKGAHTCITCPDGNSYFNNSGNPGMAKGGSGDVLTGLITGLLAQGYSALHASLIGVFLHGMAGDLAAEAYGQNAMKAGDLVACLPEAFKSLEKV